MKLIHDTNSPAPRFRGMWHALVDIPRREGVVRGLWCGGYSTTLKTATTYAIRCARVWRCCGVYMHQRRTEP